MAQPPMIEPREFLKSSESVIASYDWTDIVEGSGKVLFYGCADILSGSTTYSLLTNQLYSSFIDSATSGNNTLTFYTPEFNLPRIMEGSAYVNFCGYIDGGGTMYATAKLTHYRGATSLGDITAEITGDGVSTTKMILLKLPLTKRVNVKKGDKIALTIHWHRMTAGWAAVAFDPQNRDGTYIKPSADATITSKMMLWLPFRIDLS